MGNRANFVFVQPSGDSIVLYGHWGGHEMLHNLADAVEKARGRWEDVSYATRIAISQLIGDQWDMETGWGLHINEIGDNEHKIPVIDFSQKLFSLHSEDSFGNVSNKVRGVSNEPIFVMDLNDFCIKYAEAPALV